jgi:hypothetical protein
MATIKVKVTRSAKGEYEHEAQGNRNQKIKLKRNGGAFLLRFEIDEDLDHRFDTANPFLCDVTNGACPTRLDTNQFKVVSCADKLLIVKDSNSNSWIADYNFKLNFADGKPPYDPVIQNGGRTGITKTVAFVAVAGVVAIAAITYFAGLWRF